jgi:hypothetical protein
MSEKKRVISPEPRIVMLLKKRPVLVERGPYRTAVLDFLEDVGRSLRNRDSWVQTTASVTQTIVVSVALTRILALLGIQVVAAP